MAPIVIRKRIWPPSSRLWSANRSQIARTQTEVAHKPHHCCLNSPWHTSRIDIGRQESQQTASGEQRTSQVSPAARPAAHRPHRDTGRIKWAYHAVTLSAVAAPVKLLLRRRADHRVVEVGYHVRFWTPADVFSFRRRIEHGGISQRANHRVLLGPLYGVSRIAGQVFNRKHWPTATNSRRPQVRTCRVVPGRSANRRTDTRSGEPTARETSPLRPLSNW